MRLSSSPLLWKATFKEKLFVQDEEKFIEPVKNLQNLLIFILGKGQAKGSGVLRKRKKYQ